MKTATQLAVAATVFLAAILYPAAAPGQEEPAGGAEAPSLDGPALLEAGRAQEALDAFERALEADPDDPALLTGAGRAAIAISDFSLAIQYLSRAVHLAPDAYEPLLERARAFAAQGRELFYSGEQNDGYMMLQDAAAMFSAAAELDPTAVAPLLERADIHVELSEYEEADQVAIQVLERDPGNLKALLVRGDAAYLRFQDAAGSGGAAGDVKEIWNEAMRLYQKAHEADPEATGPYLGMAALFEADKKWEEASDAVMKALVIEPELLPGYDRLISLFNNPEGRDKLVALLDVLIQEIEKKYPGDQARRAAPRYYSGYARFLNLDYESAAAQFAAAAECNAEYRTASTYYIARARFALNEYGAAARDFFRILASDPQGFEHYLRNDPAWQNVCMSLSFLSNHSYEAGNLNMARDLLGGVLMVIRTSPDFFNNYAFLCRETGQYEDAYQAYREALSLAPTDPSILNDTALILQYHLNRDLDYARELYNRAIGESQRIIEDDKASNDEKEAARTALRDATTNLKAMDRKGRSARAEEAPR